MFENIFAGEWDMLLDTLNHEDEGYQRGVSLIALVERTSGVIQARGKPRTVDRDYYNPVGDRRVAERV
jgi:hypothetical protein